MSEAANAPEGLTIENRYRIIRKIADGGMATVYQALDERLERIVAIKIMHTQLAQGPHRDQFVERFRREAKSAAAIANPHIVQVYDTGEFEGLDYLVMEYVHGVNLRHEMNEQGTFSVRETLRVISETIDGLAAAHRVGVVHRDIKPENILINDRGRVQITDFGLARAASQATLSSTGMLLGTAAYLAPEMIENNQAVPQGDLYSVGIMAWEMLSGAIPFVSDNPVTLVFKHVHEDVPSVATLCPGIDPTVAGFISHLTARSLDARPSDAIAARNELQELMVKLPMEALQYRKEPSAQGLTQSDDTLDNSSTLDTATAGVPVSTSSNVAAEPPTSVLPSDNTVPPRLHGVEPSASVRSTDNQETQMIPAQPEQQPTEAIGLAAVSDVESTTQAASATHPAISRKGKIAIAAAAAALIVAAIAGFAWWQYLGPGSYTLMPQPTDLTCEENKACAIADVDWADYKSTLEVSNIQYEVREVFSDTIAEERVISTDPANVGDRVDNNGGSVIVTISKGVEQATVPSDITDPQSDNGKDPLAALTAAGFTNIKHDATSDDYSETVPQGALISISVDPGTTVDHNMEITIVLSKGPMPVAMPQIVGITRDEAASMLEEAKLKANWSEAFDDAIPAGQVISSSQDSGTQLHWGDTVDVVVSKGPETAKIPSGLVGKNESEVTKQLQELGFEVKTDKILGGLFGTVRDIQYNGTSVSDGGDVRLRDENGNATVITLTIV